MSPETGFYAPDGTGPNVLSYVSNGTSHDQLLGREALRNYIYACGELGVRTPTLLKAVQFLRKIPSLPSVPTEGCRNGGSLLKKCRRATGTSATFTACSPARNGMFSILRNMRRPYASQPISGASTRIWGNNGIRTGWSTAWLINLYAALGDGNAAEDRMYTMLRHYINSNLFDLHPRSR